MSTRTLFRGLAVGVALTLAATPAAHAKRRTTPTQWTVTSPDQSVSATVTKRHGRVPRLTVRHDGRRVLSGQLGLNTSRGNLDTGLRFKRRTVRRADGTYELPTGKQRVRRMHARQMQLTFTQRKLRVTLTVRASDDGVAYRYQLGGRGHVRLLGERSNLTAPGDTQAWLSPYQTNYEAPYLEQPLAQAKAGRYAFPALLHTQNSWALVSESGLAGRFPGSHLRANGGTLNLTLAEPVRVKLPAVTPWRTIVVGGLDTVVQSTLNDDLGGAAQLRDFSWVKPGRAAWSWWSDSPSPKSLDRQKHFVDFAASEGWEYVLVDAGWDGAWVPELVAYAAARNVKILLWSEWNALRTPAQQRELLGRWSAWGVAGVKLDFMHSDKRARIAWYEQVARTAAEFKLVVNFHGSTLPRGIQRRWPNVMTSEGVQGAENYKGSQKILSPQHNLTLPFTRNAVGSMDYTPVTFSARTRDTSDAHELALSVVFESAIQHYADSPESYRSHPAALDFLRDVPAAWDETRLLDGYPGQHATIARRSGESWWVGSVTVAARRQALPLSFLPAGRSFKATVVADQQSTARMSSQDTIVTADSVLELDLANGGGAVLKLVPAG